VYSEDDETAANQAPDPRDAETTGLLSVVLGTTTSWQVRAARQTLLEHHVAAQSARLLVVVDTQSSHVPTRAVIALRVNNGSMGHGSMGQMGQSSHVPTRAIIALRVNNGSAGHGSMGQMGQFFWIGHMGHGSMHFHS